MSAHEHAPGRAPQRYGTIIVVSGGCYGSYYLRQLRRAAAAGAIAVERVLIVDRDGRCAVASAIGETADVKCELAVRDAHEFFDDYLTTAARHPESVARDAIVPSPMMPNLMGEWLVQRARARFGDRVATRPFDVVPDVPWERAGADGTQYVSFATWMCPINCVEPRVCPHTRDVRSWSMPQRLATHAAERRAAGALVESAVLFCRHRAYGVGMFDTNEVLAADRRIAERGAAGAGEFIIGTVSHCHGALTRLVIDARREPEVDSVGSRVG